MIAWSSRSVAEVARAHLWKRIALGEVAFIAGLLLSSFAAEAQNAMPGVDLAHHPGCRSALTSAKRQRLF